MISGTLASSQSIAGLAIAPPYLLTCILWRKFMPAFAMRPLLARHGAYSRAHLQPFGKDIARRRNYLRERDLARRDPCLDGVGLLSAHAGQISQEVSFSFDHVSDRNASVGLASLVRNPSAICRLVISIVIDSIEKMIGGPLAHICQESFKLIPTRANRNPSASIIFPLAELGIATPPSHGLPHGIKRVGIFKWHKLSLGESNQYRKTGS